MRYFLAGRKPHGNLDAAAVARAAYSARAIARETWSCRNRIERSLGRQFSSVQHTHNLRLAYAAVSDACIQSIRPLETILRRSSIFSLLSSA